MASVDENMPLTQIILRISRMFIWQIDAKSKNLQNAYKLFQDDAKNIDQKISELETKIKGLFK